MLHLDNGMLFNAKPMCCPDTKRHKSPCLPEDDLYVSFLGCQSAVLLNQAHELRSTKVLAFPGCFHWDCHYYHPSHYRYGLLKFSFKSKEAPLTARLLFLMNYLILAEATCWSSREWVQTAAAMFVISHLYWCFDCSTFRVQTFFSPCVTFQCYPFS